MTAQQVGDAGRSIVDAQGYAITEARACGRDDVAVAQLRVLLVNEDDDERRRVDIIKRTL